MVIPPIAKQYSHRVRPFLQKMSYIVRNIKITPVVTGIHRVETMISYSLTINVHFHQSSNSYISPCGRDLFFGVELLSEVRSGFMMDIIAITDPRSLPIGNIHHSRFKGMNFSTRLLSLFVPHDNLPEIACKRKKGVTIINDQLFICSHLACIPCTLFVLNKSH